jgi:heme o synthase
MSLATDHTMDYAAAISEGATPADYFALLKPRVMYLVVITAMTGMAIAPGHMHPLFAFTAILAIAVGAGASGALNMWYDADIDAVMTRTKTRPIPSGAVTGDQALTFGLILSVFSVALLGIVANWLAAGMLAFTIFFYAVIYTMWLKRWTPQNIVIGGAAGAIPPMIGYAAATGSVSLEACVLFAIIFIWTPPHFWALALVKSADYARANVPMMPNAKGTDRTRLEILIYTLMLAPCAVMPFIMGFAGYAYGALSVVSGLYLVHLAVAVYRTREGDGAKKTCMRLFGMSIIYLLALYTVLLAEHATGLFARTGW